MATFFCQDKHLSLLVEIYIYIRWIVCCSTALRACCSLDPTGFFYWHMTIYYKGYHPNSPRIQNLVFPFKGHLRDAGICMTYYSYTQSVMVTSLSNRALHHFPTLPPPPLPFPCFSSNTLSSNYFFLFGSRIHCDSNQT